MLKKKCNGLKSLVVAALLVLSTAPAYADVTISPLRVVFQGRDRSAVVSLVNLANYVNTYRVSWTFYKMTDKGGYNTIKADPNDPHTVDKMVIFSPRQVVIRPEQHQLVRLSVRRPADLPPGEYRGHLTFTRLPPEVERRRVDTKEKELQQKKEKGQRTALQVSVSLSIPVIVRNGDDPDLKIDIQSPKFEMTDHNGVQKSSLTMDLARVAGKFSTYGTVSVFWKKPGGEKETRIGVLNNVAVYPEIQKRRISVALTGEKITGGTIRIIYEGKYESKGTIWAEKTIPVGG
jgi:fimbrial chaperone protein